jgi:hypothetical protein
MTVADHISPFTSVYTDCFCWHHFSTTTSITLTSGAKHIKKLYILVSHYNPIILPRFRARCSGGCSRIEALRDTKRDSHESDGGEKSSEMIFVSR